MQVPAYREFLTSLQRNLSCIQQEREMREAAMRGTLMDWSQGYRVPHRTTMPALPRAGQYAPGTLLDNISGNSPQRLRFSTTVY